LTPRLPGLGSPRAAMIKAEAQANAHSWIEAFNDRDLEGILSHYADDADGRIAKILSRAPEPARRTGFGE
jgi:hypothetical protein